jgi:DNA-binding CsgD family transcriptional regulator
LITFYVSLTFTLRELLHYISDRLNSGTITTPDKNNFWPSWGRTGDSVSIYPRMNIAASIPIVGFPCSAHQESAHEAAFVAFYMKHAKTLFHKLTSGFWVNDDKHQRRHRRGVDRFLAEDVCQQVWVEMWLRLKAGKAVSAVTLYQRADARITDYHRSVRRFRQLDESHFQPAKGPSRDERLDLDKAIGRLALRDRWIVRSWLDGHTAKEIAAEHGVHPNTILNGLRKITTMKNETSTASTTKQTTQKVLSALPGTPAEVAKKAAITREAAKKQLQRLQKAGKVENEDGRYSLAIPPVDNSELVDALMGLLDKMARKQVRIAPYRFDDKRVAESKLSTMEPPEMPTKEAREILDSQELESTPYSLPTAEPEWSKRYRS